MSEASRLFRVSKVSRSRRAQTPSIAVLAIGRARLVTVRPVLSLLPRHTVARLKCVRGLAVQTNACSVVSNQSRVEWPWWIAIRPSFEQAGCLASDTLLQIRPVLRPQHRVRSQYSHRDPDDMFKMFLDDLAPWSLLGTHLSSSTNEIVDGSRDSLSDHDPKKPDFLTISFSAILEGRFAELITTSKA